VCAGVTAEVDEIDKPTDEDISSENATFFQLCEDVSRAAPLGRGRKPTDEDISSENVDSECPHAEK